jgi:hypothetical protein
VTLGVSLIKMTTLLDSEAKALAMAGESIGVVRQLKSYLLIHNRNAFLYSLHQDPNRLANSIILRQEISDLLATMERLVNNEEEDLALSGLENEITSYLVKWGRLDRSGMPAVQQYEEVSNDVDELIFTVDRLIEVNQSQMEILVETIGRQNKVADKIGFFLLVLGGVTLLGIAPQGLDEIFKPFNRTEATRGTIPGMGLGLSASRHIIERHGGELKLKASLIRGQHFISGYRSKHGLHNASVIYCCFKSSDSWPDTIKTHDTYF